ncbi:cuticle protein AMP4-like [Macrobrachium rosenbergii]|uniref:cuticle protein AMP4-like n=1 Tax=Macrobrachium rosenbergii TaxID=79674 RepID=UPI0034D4D148
MRLTVILFQATGNFATPGMKIVILTCLISLALGRPQILTPEELNVVETIRDARSDEGDGNFAYEFETANGILVSAAGTPGEEGQSNIEGSYRFPMGDGRVLEVTYTADERGYRPATKILDA